MAAAARAEPMNCSRRGMAVVGMGVVGVDRVGMESTSSSKRDGVLWRKRARLSSRAKVEVKWTRVG